MTYGIHSDFAPQPDGSYSQGASAARYVFISGQIGQAAPAEKGQSSGALIGPDTESQLRQAIANLQALLCEVKLGLDDVVKVNVYLLDLDDLPIVDAVMEELFLSPLPARTVVEVRKLRSQARVEVECIACR